MESGDDTPVPSGILSALSDFRHSLETEFRQPARQLLVKERLVVFDQNTVYWSRAAFHKGLMMTAARP